MELVSVQNGVIFSFSVFIHFACTSVIVTLMFLDAFHYKRRLLQRF